MPAEKPELRPGKAERLGERAVRLGYATEPDVAAALARQRTSEDATGHRVPLGALLVEMGTLAPAQLVRLLDDSNWSGFHLSEDAVQLATRLHRSLGRDQRVVLVAGVRQADGVTTIASQVALAMALMGQGPVLIVDANVRDPAVHKKFFLPLSPGLIEVLDGRTPVDQATHSSGLAGLHVLPAGEPSGDVLARLLSDECETILQELRRRFRVILIDAPGLLDLPDGALLASRVDSVLLVAGVNRRTRSQVNEIVRILKGLHANVIGIVLSTRRSRRGRLVEA